MRDASRQYFARWVNFCKQAVATHCVGFERNSELRQPRQVIGITSPQSRDCYIFSTDARHRETVTMASIPESTTHLPLLVLDNGLHGIAHDFYVDPVV